MMAEFLLDSNVILRLLLDDDEDQTPQVAALVDSAEFTGINTRATFDQAMRRHTDADLRPPRDAEAAPA